MKELKQIGDSSKGKASKSNTTKRSPRDTKYVTLSYPWLFTFIILFLTIPLFIFFLGYLRLAVGIPLTLIFAGIVFYAVSDCLNNAEGRKLDRSDTDIKIPVSYPPVQARDIKRSH